MPATQHMTADEFLALPEPLDARRMELVGGEVVVQVPFLHQIVTVEILHAMTSWVRSAEGRGTTALPLDVLIDPNNIFNPDILWYTAASEVLIFRRSGQEATSFDVALELERGDTLTSPQLDGFELPLAELFPE